MKPVSELTDAELAAKGWRRVNWSVKEPPDPRLDVWVDERGVLRLYAHQWGPYNRADHCGEEK